MVIRVHGAASEPAYKSQKIMWVDPKDALVPLPVKKVAESRPPPPPPDPPPGHHPPP